MGITTVGRPTKGHRFYCWNRHAECYRCHGLYQRHKLKLIEVIAMWEAQGRRCYRYPDCSRTLIDPRLGEIGGESFRVDHDHAICPQRWHSCKLCRRGLACQTCNIHELAVKSRGLWVLPQSDGLVRWLEFLGPANRDRLRQALALFPEQPVRRASRRRSHDERAPEEIAPLFDLDAYRAPA